MRLMEKLRVGVRYLWDLFTLFNGVSTPSGLARTQGRPIRSRGIFMFRPPKTK